MAEEVVLRRNLDDHGTLGRLSGDCASAAEGDIDFGSLLCPKLSLGYRPRDGELVHVVKLERLSHVAAYAASENEHGHAVQVGLGDPGERVCQACARNHVYGCKLA